MTFSISHFPGSSVLSAPWATKLCVIILFSVVATATVRDFEPAKGPIYALPFRTFPGASRSFLGSISLPIQGPFRVNKFEINPCRGRVIENPPSNVGRPRLTKWNRSWISLQFKIRFLALKFILSPSLPLFNWRNFEAFVAAPLNGQEMKKLCSDTNQVREKEEHVTIESLTTYYRKSNSVEEEELLVTQLSAGEIPQSCANK